MEVEFEHNYFYHNKLLLDKTSLCSQVQLAGYVFLSSTKDNCNATEQIFVVKYLIACKFQNFLHEELLLGES